MKLDCQRIGAQNVSPAWVVHMAVFQMIVVAVVVHVAAYVTDIVTWGV